MISPAQAPALSVLLPVYNGERYLAEAVRSVLSQTFTDFELLVIDDGSTDETGAIISGFSDPRLRVIRFAENRGLAAALNCGINESRSELIARMDADDICLPRRFETQAAFLRAHSEVDICGTWTRSFGTHVRTRRLPVEPEEIRARMFFGGALDHPTLMMRRAFLEQNNLAYRDDYPFAEDLDFLIRAADAGTLANVPEVLLLYRLHSDQASVVRAQEQAESYKRLLLRQLRTLVPEGSAGAAAARDEEELHVRLITAGVSESELVRAENWLLQLERANGDCNRFERTAFLRELRRVWFYAHTRCSSRCLGSLGLYWGSPLRGVRGIGILRHLRLAAGCLFHSPGRRITA